MSLHWPGFLKRKIPSTTSSRPSRVSARGSVNPVATNPIFRWLAVSGRDTRRRPTRRRQGSVRPAAYPPRLSDNAGAGRPGFVRPVGTIAHHDAPPFVVRGDTPEI